MTPKASSSRRGRRGPSAMALEDFELRKPYSRQSERIKRAVQAVLVDNVPANVKSRDLGISRAALSEDVQRFLHSTSVQNQRMTAENFDKVSARRRNSKALKAVRLYLVDGYSLGEACRTVGVPSRLVYSAIKRMRAALQKEQYSSPVVQRPSAEELQRMQHQSVVVRKLSENTYSRAYAVFIDERNISDLALEMGCSTQAICESLRATQHQCERMRFHEVLPHDESYLALLDEVMPTHRIPSGFVRMATQHYMRSPVALSIEDVAAKFNVKPSVLQQTIKAVSNAMDRLRGFRKH